jgi:hypothetical protein
VIADKPHPSDEELPATPPRPHVNGAPARTLALPNSPEAEAGLLGCCFVDPADVLRRAEEAGIVQSSFYDPLHGAIFRTMLRCRARGLPIDQAVVAEELKGAPEFAGRNIFATIVQVSESTATTAQATYFIDQVRGLAVRRELIRTALAVAEDAAAHRGDIGPLIEDVRLRMESVGGKPAARVARTGIDAFLVPPDSDASVLLGNRYLCRGDGMVLVSSSGMGKSALSLQAAVCWAFGLPFMGVRPNGQLRSLIIQSEDSDGDIAEVWASICYRMRLTAEQRAHAGQYVQIVSDRIHRGPAFLAELARQVAARPYDLVWINPLAAFISGDATTQETTADFLRAGLNGINTPAAFGYIIIQHTTKPATGKERSERKWFEVMYDMAGSYDLVGWARAIISLRPTDTTGDFNLVLAKRGSRAGITKKVPHGIGYRLESTTTIPLRHSTERMEVDGIPGRTIPVIFWEPREEVVASKVDKPEDRGGRPRQHSFADFITIFPIGPAAGLGFRPLHKIASELKPIGRGAFDSIISDAVSVGRLVCDTSDPTRPRYYRPLTDGLL